MDQIALISDIHGNTPALQAVAADMDARGVHTIYSLGDMCGRGPCGAEVIDWCRSHCDAILMGNWEDFLIRAPKQPKAQKYIGQLGEQRFQFLHTLPFTKTFWFSGRRIHLFHGRPVHETLVFDESPNEEKHKLFSAVPDKHPPDVVGYADIHRQFKTDFISNGKTLFNVGSVGNSYSSPAAFYVILHGIKDQQTPAPFSIEFISVPYDIAAAVENARAADAWFDTENYICEITSSEWHNVQ